MTIKRVAVVAVSLVLAVPALALAKVSFFLSPTHNISCQVSSGQPLGTKAYCQTLTPPQSAILHPDGKTTVCHGEKCLGNPPDDATTLRYGHSITVKPFRCFSSTAGMNCLIVKTGHGFKISKSGITHS
jgi:hypothetical protein